MRVIKNTNKANWNSLSKRPEFKRGELEEVVKEIMLEVRDKKDKALLNCAKKYDNAELKSLVVDKTEIEKAVKSISKDLKSSIDIAKANIQRFHLSQISSENEVETTDGVKCWRKSVGIEKVGLYIPGGSAPLFSTILMLGIPAKIAGCKEVVLCTPPDKNGKINPAILYTASLIGISKIYKVGGAQAIAAMTYGTESIPQVYKIFGPGNQFVTKAKGLVQQEGIAIDMPAGPSELLVIVDKTSNPIFVAADLLSQAEHGTDSQVVLLSDNEALISEIIKEVKTQLFDLPRRKIAEKALKNSFALVLNDLNECIEFSNSYAPEHLIIAIDSYNLLLDKITNAGSVFLGKYSCESAGDYASGTNHTLPTNGFARNYSGVSVDSFTKKITFQNLTSEGIKNIGPAIEIMAEAEQLIAHKNAVTVRLKSLQND